MAKNAPVRNNTTKDLDGQHLYLLSTDNDISIWPKEKYFTDFENFLL